MSLSSLNFEEIQKQLIAALRGDRSQAKLSELLGYRHNQFRKWESSERSISWRNFLRVTEYCNVDMQNALRRGLAFEGMADDAAGIVRHLVGYASSEDVRILTNLTRHQLQRWLKGQNEPSLQDMFRLMHLSALNLTEFVCALVDIDEIDELKDIHKDRQALRAVVRVTPDSLALMAAMTLGQSANLEIEPSNSEALTYLALKSGLSEQQASEILADIVKAGALRKAGERFWISQGMDLADSTDGVCDIVAHLAQRGREVSEVRRRQPYEHASYEVAALSTDARDEIGRRTSDFYRAVRAICAKDEQENKNCLLVVAVQCFDPARKLDGLAGSESSPD